jgi:hypothetical protein
MNLFDDDRIPTPEECFQEYAYKSQLEKLEKECAHRKAVVETLESVEQYLRESIVSLSSTLSQLYALAGTLSQAGMQKNEEE